MKKLILASALFAAVSSVQAADLSEGTREFSVQGNAQFGSDYDVILESSYGKFIRDNWELGGNLSTRVAKDNKLVRLGVFTEYNFASADSNWVPFVGAASEVAGFMFEGPTVEKKDDESFALNVKLTAGVKYFVNKNVAISASVNHNIATDDISMSGDELKNTLTNVVIGTRFYF